MPILLRVRIVSFGIRDKRIHSAERNPIMSSPLHRMFRLLLPGICLGLLLIGAWPVGAQNTSPTSLVGKQRVMQIDLPAGSLSDSLNALARQAVLTLSVDAGLVSGKSVPAVSGLFTAEQVLQRLLAGSGLSYRFSGDSTVVLQTAAAPAQPLELSEIMVKGELQERTLQDTQTSVSVVSGEELDRSTDKDLFDTVDRLPNVSAQGGGFGFVIRGITDSGPGGAGQAQAISVQVDGAAVPNGQALHTGAVSTWDLEQAEILRGPQSTQQGPNALAGAIILRSKDPTFKQEFKARADYGSFDETRLAVAANMPLNDRFAVRFSAEDYRSDGDISHVITGEDTADEFLKTYRAKLRFMPSEDLDIVLGYTQSKNRRGVQAIIQDEFPSRRVAQQENNQEGVTDIANLRIFYDLGQYWSLQSETTHLTSDYGLDIPLEPFNPNNTPANRTVDDKAISQELKLQYQADSLSGVIGVYYRETDKEVFFNAIVPEVPDPFPPGISAIFSNSLDQDIENRAVFGEVEYEVDRRWTVIAGLRYDTEEQESVSTNFSVFTPEPFPGSNSPPVAVKLDAEYSALLPKVGVIYDWTDTVSTGLTVQRGYRAGGSATESVGSRTYEYDPEFTTNYEFSLRSLSMSDRLRFNANLFYTKYKDMQVSIPGPSNTFIDARIENAGKAKLWGGEVQANFDVTHNLNLFANIGYTKTKFDDYTGNASGMPVDLSGNEFAQAPRWTGSIGGAYYFDNGFETELDVNYTDRSYYTVNNDRDELNKAFTLVNARVGYQSDSFWAVHLYARNLFDEQYLSRKRVDGSSTAGDSRVVGINLSVEL